MGCCISIFTPTHAHLHTHTHTYTHTHTHLNLHTHTPIHTHTLSHNNILGTSLLYRVFIYLRLYTTYSNCVDRPSTLERSFLKSYSLTLPMKNFPKFYKDKGLLCCSQNSATAHLTSWILILIFEKAHFDIISVYSNWYTRWFISFRCSNDSC
jgi:hypothetical protein